MSRGKRSAHRFLRFHNLYIGFLSRCLKITEKVSFNIASEANYVYILRGQKVIEKCQKWSILASFWKPEASGQTVLPDRLVLIWQKLVENAKLKNSNATFWVILKQCVLCKFLYWRRINWSLDNKVFIFHMSCYQCIHSHNSLEKR